MAELRLTSSDREDWVDTMNDFVEYVYPMFKVHGFTVPEAMTVWNQNKIYNQLLDIEEAIRGSSDV